MRFVESLKETNIYVNTGLCVTVSCMFLSSVIRSPLSSGCIYIYIYIYTMHVSLPLYNMCISHN